jgi:hypothetical protein
LTVDVINIPSPGLIHLCTRHIFSANDDERRTEYLLATSGGSFAECCWVGAAVPRGDEIQHGIVVKRVLIIVTFSLLHFKFSS